MGEPFPPCDRCGGEMFRLSEEGASPLVLKCRACGHCQYVEFQPPAPWPAPLEPERPSRTESARRGKGERARFRALDLSAIPASVSSEEGGPIIPVGWILIWLIVLAVVALALWFVL